MIRLGPVKTASCDEKDVLLIEQVKGHLSVVLDSDMIVNTREAVECSLRRMIAENKSEAKRS